MTRKFHFSPLFTLIAFGLVALMSYLGFWQLDRAAQKREKIAAFEKIGENIVSLPADLNTLERYTQVSIEGRFVGDRQVIMDGLSHNEYPGYQVLTPFQPVDNSDMIMVNRGWRMWRGQRNNIKGLDVTNELRTVRGRIDNFWKPGIVLGEGNAAEVSDWPRLAIYPQQQEISRWLGADVQARMLLMNQDEPDGFVREWQPAGLTSTRHIGYAFQWFALSATLLIIWLVTSFRLHPNTAETKHDNHQ